MADKKNFSAGLSLFIFLIITLFSVQTTCGSPVTNITAKNVAKNFLSYIQADNTVESIEEIISDDQTLAFLVNLNPSGYILVAGDDIRVPVKAYSLKSAFYTLPETYRQILLDELKIYSASSAAVIQAEDTGTNDAFWEFLTDPSDTSYIQAYTPDTYLITTTWGQSYPYNSFNPTISGEYTLTGCVQTALAQLMRYHEHPAAGSGVFTHQWNGQTLTAVMNRPFNWSIMPDKADGNVPKYQRDEVAKLMRDIGILNRANFGVDSTSTSFYYTEFSRAFGYSSISSMGITNPNFFTTITGEIDAGRPVILSMPSHMVIADGYASDGTGKKIHINMGWEGTDDDFYYLDQTIVTSAYSFPPNHIIYYNIRPCAGDECAPYSAVEGGNAPVISTELSDTVIDADGTIINIEAYDPDGHDVNLTVLSSCNGISAAFDSNLLTLTQQQADNYCQIKVQADSSDGTALKTFNTLTINDKIYTGSEFDIGGNFASVSEVDEYKVILSGNTTVSGTRGYSNQAFFIWIKDEAGTTTVVSPQDSAITSNFTPGVYRLYSSLDSGSGYYPYDDQTSYILSVSTDSSAYSVTDLAADMGITLQEFTVSPADLTMSSGWNLVSLALEPGEDAISTILTPVSAKVLSVWSYSSGWKVYDPDYPDFSELTTMETGKGYWINLTSSANLSVSGDPAGASVNLVTGWNLVGYNSETPQSPSDALASISGKYVSVWAYIEGGWKVYDPSNPDFSDLQQISPAYGYWINATEACTWTLP